MRDNRKNRTVLIYLIITVMWICVSILIETLYMYYNLYYYRHYDNYFEYLSHCYFYEFISFHCFSICVVLIYIIYWILLLYCNCSILCNKSIVNNDGNMKLLNSLYLWLFIGKICTITALCAFIIILGVLYIILCFWCSWLLIHIRDLCTLILLWTYRYLFDLDIFR